MGERGGDDLLRGPPMSPRRPHSPPPHPSATLVAPTSSCSTRRLLHATPCPPRARFAPTKRPPGRLAHRYRFPLRGGGRALRQGVPPWAPFAPACARAPGGRGGVSPCAPPPHPQQRRTPPPVPEGLSQSQLLGRHDQSVHALCHPLCPPHWTVYRGGGGGASAHCRNVHHRQHNIHKGPQGGPAVVTRANTVWGTRLLFGPLLLLH